MAFRGIRREERMHKGLLWAAWGLSIAPMGTVMKYVLFRDFIWEGEWQSAAADAFMVIMLLIASFLCGRL